MSEERPFRELRARLAEVGFGVDEWVWLHELPLNAMLEKIDAQEERIAVLEGHLKAAESLMEFNDDPA